MIIFSIIYIILIIISFKDIIDIVKENIFFIKNGIRTQAEIIDCFESIENTGRNNKYTYYHFKIKYCYQNKTIITIVNTKNPEAYYLQKGCICEIFFLNDKKDIFSSKSHRNLYDICKNSKYSTEINEAVRLKCDVNILNDAKESILFLLLLLIPFKDIVIYIINLF